MDLNSGYDLGLEARIFASRLGLGSQNPDLRGGMEEEKILFMKCATKSNFKYMVF